MTEAKFVELTAEQRNMADAIGQLLEDEDATLSDAFNSMMTLMTELLCHGATTRETAIAAARSVATALVKNVEAQFDQSTGETVQ